ncbi:sensor histidine kinase [Aquimarina sediminis]|uniref:sensor histidine kinase n=1 Tax=Aquimarina sediminis TaxID=2070536 RepID=UPI000CA007C8|nr:sensor histidine kinase [Aquimarina sediminis]
MQEKRYLYDFTFNRKLFFIVVVLLFHFFVSAQKRSRKFTHYGKQDGLNQSSVNFIFQDSHDYVWIANFGGINKFDGYQFTSYINEFGEDTSIADNSVWTIIENRDKTLWFGTKKGLSKYNIAEDNFTNYFIRENNKSIGTLAVKALFEDEKGRFYIGSEGEGLYIFSKDKEVFYKVKEIPETAKISAVTEDLKGNLWVATENLGLFKITPDRTTSVSFLTSKKLNSRTIWCLNSDQQGNVWIGTDIQGLVKYNINTDSLTYYKKEAEKYNYKADDKIKTIVSDGKGILWIGSATKGLSYYSYTEDRFYNYTNDPYDTNSLYDNDVSSIYCGANGVLYVGFYTKGFDKVIQSPFQVLKNNPKIENTLSNNNVYSMYLDQDDILWFGTYGGGLNRYNPKTNKYKHYKHDKNDITTISHNWVRAIYEDRSNTMWIGTWGGGLNKFNKDTGVFKRYIPSTTNKNSLNHNIITAIFEDVDGELWIGTYGGGINIYQQETDDFRSIIHDRKNKYSISDDHITSFYQDKKGIIWICTYGGGLNAYNKETKQFERFLPNVDVEYSLNNHKTLHIYDEPESDFFWITTLGGGINKFYYTEKKFVNYTEKDGLSNNSTMGMLQDKKGGYWISSNTGLSYFTPNKETFVNYTMIDGLGSDDYNLEAYAKRKNGMLYFGGKNGVTYFNPEEMPSVTTFPKVMFTHIKIEDSIYNIIPDRLEVPYESRAIFEYAAVNPDKTNKIRYSYQLIGRDKDWRFMDKNRYLEFENLNPGKYELRVKSTNSSEVWNKKYVNISLYVPTPWYMAWYFRTFIILTSLLIGYSYYRFKINRIEERNKLLEKIVDKRTKTIQEKNKALGIEKDRTEKAYQELKKLENFKDEFTGMLAHDLKNPLVTILGYSTETSTNSNLKSINKSGKMMLNLIENMLEVQKFESTDLQLNIGNYNLKNIALEGMNQIDLLAIDKRIQVDNTINPGYNVNVDRNIIERVFVNLLTNAIKFSKPDTKIEILAKVESKHADKITVCIKDNGVGMPEHLLTTIFNKFSQIEVRDSGVARSTGLGLSFCKMAIEAHECEISVRSEINKGSSFFFTLPRLKDSIVAHIPYKKMGYKNPLYDLRLDENDFNLLNSVTEKINILTIYEMGGWLDVFDDLTPRETNNIKKWKDMMMEALTNFDKNAFLYLKEIAINPK